MCFENFDFTKFWDDSDYAKKEYIGPPPSDALIAEVERELGYKLPASSIWLMKRHNGGIPVNTCFPTETPTNWAEDRVAICDCPSAGHNMIFLDYRDCGPQGEPKVVHVDQEYDYAITPLADTFGDFIQGLVNSEVYEPDPEAENVEALELVRTAPF